MVTISNTIISENLVVTKQLENFTTILEPNGSLVLIPNLQNSMHDLHHVSKNSF